MIESRPKGSQIIINLFLPFQGHTLSPVVRPEAAAEGDLGAEHPSAAGLRGQGAERGGLSELPDGASAIQKQALRVWHLRLQSALLLVVHGRPADVVLREGSGQVSV